MSLTFGQGGRPLVCPHCRRRHVDTKEEQFPHREHRCETCAETFKTPIACVGVDYKDLDFGKQSGFVPITIRHITYHGHTEMGHPIECPGVEVLCTRCFATQEVGGRSEESVSRGGVMLREECPWEEKNLYLTAREIADRKAENAVNRRIKARVAAEENVYHPIFGCESCGHEFSINKPKQTAQCVKCGSTQTKFLRIPEEEKRVRKSRPRKMKVTP